MKYPFHDSTNISIRLLRKGPENNDGVNDDQIAIVENENDVYDVYYHYGEWQTEKTAHFIQMNGDDLDNYLWSMFTLLARDADPFRSIQFNLPCMPSILLEIDDLKKKGVREALTTVMPLLRSCLKVKF